MNQFTMRRATAADAEALVAFNGDVLRHQDADEPDERTAAWAHDLASGRHPHFAVSDFLIVEEPRTHAIVSSMCLIPETWSYGGIEFGVGNPELVGTRADQRGQGLVRQQFAEIHRWSAARGDLALAIDGVPWFYRQFGYEMALALRNGCTVDSARVPPLSGAGAEEFRVRPPADADLTFVAQTYASGAARYLVTGCRDETSWRYELSGRNAASMYCAQLRVIEARGGQPVGCVVHTSWLLGSAIWVIACELAPGFAWDNVAPAVLRYLRATGEQYAARDRNGPCERIGFWFGTEHPMSSALRGRDLQPDPPYAWYMRVPDLPRFLRHVAPVLDRRLAASAFAGYSGELLLSFYRDGLRLEFQRGRLADVTPWRQSRALNGVERLQTTAAPRAGAMFPDLTFLQLLFGYRTLGELQHAFADCLVRTDEARALLLTLFPKQPSNVWPVL